MFLFANSHRLSAVSPFLLPFFRSSVSSASKKNARHSFAHLLLERIITVSLILSTHSHRKLVDFFLTPTFRTVGLPHEVGFSSHTRQISLIVYCRRVAHPRSWSPAFYLPSQPYEKLCCHLLYSIWRSPTARGEGEYPAGIISIFFHSSNFF